MGPVVSGGILVQDDGLAVLHRSQDYISILHPLQRIKAYRKPARGLAPQGHVEVLLIVSPRYLHLPTRVTRSSRARYNHGTRVFVLSYNSIGHPLLRGHPF